MRTLIKFEKKQGIKYISHLDLQRAMHRAINRAGLPVEYSHGFHPLPEVSFALALAVGAESEAEYMEVSFLQEVTAQQVIPALNAVFPVGLHVLDFCPIADKAPSLMSAVAASRWHVTLPEPRDDLLLRVMALLKQPQAEVERLSKGKTRMVDIRPGIYSLQMTPTGIEMLLAAGSAFTVRPGEVLQLLQQAGEGTLCRTQMLAKRNEDFVDMMDHYRRGF